MATIGACGAFAAVSGSSVATAAAMGTVALPEMDRFKYDPRLSTGSVAAGGTLGFLIPPSIGFVVYGMLTEQSIGKAAHLRHSARHPSDRCLCHRGRNLGEAVAESAPRNLEPVSWTDKITALKGVKEPLFIFLFAIGGIYAGLFTPDEAAAVGATCCFLSRYQTQADLAGPFHCHDRVAAHLGDGVDAGSRRECVQLLHGPFHHPRAGGQLGDQPRGFAVRIFTR